MDRDHSGMVNRLIATRLNQDVYQTVATLIPEIYKEQGNLDPTEILQCIKAQLVTAHQLEYKGMKFELAKPISSENPWKYGNSLLSYY